MDPPQHTQMFYSVAVARYRVNAKSGYEGQSERYISD